MLLLERVLGRAGDASLAGPLHDLAHRGRVEHLRVSPADAARRRLRLTTDAGTECAIALERPQRLEHGSVLLLEPDRAIVVQLEEVPWLRVAADSAEAALRLGFVAGHHHWRVEFDGPRLRIALDVPRQHYLDRLHGYFGEGGIRVEG